MKSILMWNLQHIIFIWRQRYWQISKSVIVCLNILIRQTLTNDFWGLHKNMNCAFPLTQLLITKTFFKLGMSVINKILLKRTEQKKLKIISSNWREGFWLFECQAILFLRPMTYTHILACIGCIPSDFHYPSQGRIYPSLRVSAEG